MSLVRLLSVIADGQTLLPDFPRHLHGKGQVALGGDLGYVGRGVPERHLGGFQPEAFPHLGAVVMP